MFGRLPRPSPAMVVALIALFIALTGTAVAAGVVPLAKRALVADNAMKLQGKTLSSLIVNAGNLPSPANTAAGLVTIKVAQWSVNPGRGVDFTTACDSGQKAIAGGWDDPAGYAHEWDSRPAADGGSWRLYMSVSPEAPATQSGGLYVVCLK